jgi:hypothetical protein
VVGDLAAAADREVDGGRWFGRPRSVRQVVPERAVDRDLVLVRIVGRAAEAN